MQAFLAVYGANDQLSSAHQKIVTMAKYLEQQLRSRKVITVNPAGEQLLKTMQWISKDLPKNLRPQAYRGVIELYQDKPWPEPLSSRREKH